MKKILCLIFAGIFLLGAYGDNKSIYSDLLSKNMMGELFTHLEKWQAEEPANPEMFIGFFNYYLNLAMTSGVSLDITASNGEDYMEISDPKTGRVVGYLNDKTYYDFEKTNMALSFLDKGLAVSPDRLDMVFGKTYVLIEVKDYARALEILSFALDRSIKNGNKWLWSDNQSVEDGENFLLGNMQDYYESWINEGSPQALTAVEALSLIQIEKYPNHIYAYDNYAIAKSIKKEYSEALKYLKIAEKLDPADLVVINNIANCYRNMGDKEMAIAYYSKIVKSDNKEYSAYAQKKIDSLK